MPKPKPCIQAIELTRMLVNGGHKNFFIRGGFHDRGHKKHDGAIINMNKILAKIAKVTPNDKILDAGCGFGESAIWLAKNLGANVVGIDINQMQVNLARKLARNITIVSDSVKFFVRDFMNTNFKENSFDVIWCLESACHAKNIRDFLAESKRILKNTGRIIVADGFLKKENVTKNEERDISKWLDVSAIQNLVSVSEFQKYLAELGFKNIKFMDVTKNVMPYSRWLYNAAKFLRFADVVTKMQMIYTIFEYYQYVTLKKGLWVYGIFYAEK